MSERGREGGSEGGREGVSERGREGVIEGGRGERERVRGRVGRSEGEWGGRRGSYTSSTLGPLIISKEPSVHVRLSLGDPVWAEPWGWCRERKDTTFSRL